MTTVNIVSTNGWKYLPQLKYELKHTFHNDHKWYKFMYCMCNSLLANSSCITITIVSLYCTKLTQSLCIEEGWGKEPGGLTHHRLPVEVWIQDQSTSTGKESSNDQSLLGWVSTASSRLSSLLTPVFPSRSMPHATRFQRVCGHVFFDELMIIFFFFWHFRHWIGCA